MIILDFSQIILAAVHTDCKNSGDLSPDFIRHLCLNTIRYYNQKFGPKYGEVVIAIDNAKGGYWRRTVHAEYKASRKTGRELSPIDWPLVYEGIGEIVDGLVEHFPYKVISVPGVEADDIIGTLVKQYSSTTKIMIVSSDKDFKQLHKYPGVKQFSHHSKKMVYEPNPEYYLHDHIIRGDKGDGIPNIYSPPDYYITRKQGDRPRSIPVKYVRACFGQDMSKILNSNDYKRYEQNRTLIDLECVPDELQHQILNQYNQAKTDNTAYVYLMANGLNYLIEHASQFDAFSIDNKSEDSLI